MSEPAKVLIVDDDPQVAELYARHLEATYAVEIANRGTEALAALDDEIDLLVLDRRMPDMSGDEVLDEVRARGFDVPVVMATAIDPDFDIITLPFNDYLVKPVTQADLLEAVERALTLSRRDVQIQEFFALVAKQQALEVEKTSNDLATNDAYLELADRIDDLRERVSPPIDEFEEQLAVQLSRSSIDAPVLGDSAF